MALVHSETYFKGLASDRSHEEAELASRVAPDGPGVTRDLFRSMRQLKWMTAGLLALTWVLFFEVVVMSWTL